jgi:hypothetical protein
VSRAFVPTVTHHPTFFSLNFFISTFLGVSRQGEFKNTIKVFLQKLHVENVLQNNRQFFLYQFFLDFILFYCFFGCFSAMGVQKHKTNIVSKRFYKKIDQKSKTDFLLIFDHVFGRFSVRGVQKHDKTNIGKTNLTPSLFRTLTHPPTTGFTVFFLPAPWG